MPKKKSAKRAHQSFKLSPHSYQRNQVLMFIAVAVAVGVVVGLLLSNQALASLGY